MTTTTGPAGGPTTGPIPTTGPSSTAGTVAGAGTLRELTHEACLHHLARGGVGRIAYVDPHGPVVLPVNYVFRDGLVWVRTASYSQLAIHVPDQPVAFEVDHRDDHTRTGWSVLVRGVAEHAVRDDSRVARGWPDSEPWPEGNRSMVFCVTPREITGRVLRQGPVGPSGGHGPGTVQRATALPGS